MKKLFYNGFFMNKWVTVVVYIYIRNVGFSKAYLAQIWFTVYVFHCQWTVFLPVNFNLLHFFESGST
jgi:hypothetical protein